MPGAKFECPGCGRMLEIFHNDPLFLEALHEYLSGPSACFVT